MTRLTPRAEELVRAGRAALRPSADDRERVFRALLPQLGGSPRGEGTTAPSAATVAATPILIKGLAALVGIALAGGGLSLALRLDPPPAKTHTTGPVRPVAVAPVVFGESMGDSTLKGRVRSPAGGTDVTGDSRVSAASRFTPVDKRPVRSDRADSLAEEVAMLSRASADLHGGRPMAALRALGEHQRRFPTGVLAEERSAARVQALCALGRSHEARIEIAQLARTAPRSPHLAHARSACESIMPQGK